MPPASCASVPFTVNGRIYTPPPRPLAVICIDGCADEYVSAALDRGRMPNLAHMLRNGHRSIVRGALPSFTNVNNAAIVAGAPPSVTGISGNFFLDPDSGEEVMMTSPEYLRCDTILAAAARAGRKVAMITAKDKLRRLLSRGLEGISLSAEKAEEGPEIYSAEASHFVLDTGVRLLEENSADFLYLTLTDYVQHKHAPEEDEALAFYAAMDERVGRLLELGAVVGATADHGMNGKFGPGGEPNVIYVQSELNEHFGNGLRVLCPITDPYVVHHGALGGAVYVHLNDRSRTADVARWLLQRDGITEVYEREIAAKKLELPADRIGDLVVLAGRDVVLGKTPEDHDLSGLDRPLRSHGGRYEEMVPLLLSQPLSPEHARYAQGDPRSFDVFAFLCNGRSA